MSGGALVGPEAPPPDLTPAAEKIAAALRDLRSATVGTGPDVLVSLLRAWNVPPARAKELINLLFARGLAGEFLRHAASPNDALLRWLREGNVPWSTVYAFYDFGPKDAGDFFAGFLAGAGYSVVDISGLFKSVAAAAELQQLMIAGFITAVAEKGLVESARSYFNMAAQLVEKLRQVDFQALMKTEYDDWQKMLWGKLYRLRYFEAGAQVGEAVGLIIQLVEAGVGLAKLAPKVAKATASAAQKGAKVAVRTLEDAAPIVRLLREWGTLKIRKIPSLNRSPWLYAMISSAELKAFLSSGKSLHKSEKGFEFFRITEKEWQSVGELAVAEGPGLGGPGARMEATRELFIVRDGEGNVVGKFSKDQIRIDPAVEREVDAAFERLYGPEDTRSVEAKIEAAKRVMKGLEEERKLLITTNKLKAILDGVREAAANSKRVKNFLKVPVQQTLSSAEMEKLVRKLSFEERFRFTAAFGSEVHTLMQAKAEALFSKTKGFVFNTEKVIRDFFPHGGNPLVLEMTLDRYYRKFPFLGERAGGTDAAAFLKRFGHQTIGDMRLDFVVTDPLGCPVLIVDWTSMAPRTLREAAEIEKALKSGASPLDVRLSGMAADADLTASKQVHLMKTMFYQFFFGTEKGAMIEAGEVYYLGPNIWGR